MQMSQYAVCPHDACAALLVRYFPLAFPASQRYHVRFFVCYNYIPCGLCLKRFVTNGKDTARIAKLMHAGFAGGSE